MDFPLLIRQRLKELGTEQRDLAVAAQVTESYISQLLTGKKTPPRTLFDRHPNICGLFPQDLSKLYAHFDATLTLVIDNLGRIGGVNVTLRELGVKPISIRRPAIVCLPYAQRPRLTLGWSSVSYVAEAVPQVASLSASRFFSANDSGSG